LKVYLGSHSEEVGMTLFFHVEPNLQFIVKYTLLYMTSVSKTVQQTLENPSSNMSVEEKVYFTNN
jgi:hypothetical protein